MALLQKMHWVGLTMAQHEFVHFGVPVCCVLTCCWFAALSGTQQGVVSGPPQGLVPYGDDD